MTSTLLRLLFLSFSSTLTMVVAHDVPRIQFAGYACDDQVTPRLYTSPSPGAVDNLERCVELCEASSDCSSVTFYELSKWCTHFYTPCASLKPGHGATTVTLNVDPYWTLASIGYGKKCQGQALDSSGKQQTLAKCKATCDLASECTSVTFSFDSKACSHFSSTCDTPAKETKSAHIVSMVKRTQQSKCDANAGEKMLPWSSGTSPNPKPKPDP